ncbi:MAG TPA: ABC transporter permease [Thermomicrobiaceae bacterium]|nr:ABC transporter permease [Thermomicrobiaceae bacterium]
MSTLTTAPVTLERPLVERSRWQQIRRLARRNPTLVVGVVLVALVILVGVIGPFVAPYAPNLQNYEGAVQPPSLAHVLGTDKFGRDQLSRVLFGARIDLALGIVTALVPLAIGVAIGAVAGFYGGWVDTIFMRIIEIQVAFPFYVLLIAILAILGPGLLNMYYALILVGWVAFARLIRGEVLVAKNLEYAVAARTLGCSDRRIILRHLLPNVIGPALIFAMSVVVFNILAGAALGFLGLGVQPPTPEWGSMVADSREFMTSAWWLPAFPGLAIAIVGVAFSVLGDGLSNVLRGGTR